MIQTSAYTTPVKCNVKINQKPQEAIIDSGASISMIAHQLVQDLGLKIEQASLSLIIPATGTPSRPLGIIRDLPIEIDGAIIPITVEVVPATSYSLLLGNDWSKKVEASYNWKNGCYSFKWKNKKHTVPTSYESNQPLPSQPTVTDPAELDTYEQEYLVPQEAYAFITTHEPDITPTSDDDTNPWIIHQPRHRKRAPPNSRVCGNCGSPEHLFANCPTNRCNRCRQDGHIAVHCPQQVPKRTSCRTCNGNDHLYRNCPENICHTCRATGHIAVDCSFGALKEQNRICQCGCNPDDIEARRMYNFSTRRTHHCCHCKKPNRPEDLQVLNNQFVCRGCVSDYYYELPLDDPQRIYYYSHGEGRGTLVQCKICGETRPTSKMNNLESLEQALWFCDLEHLYAYKAGQDVLYNANYNLWTRIRHYTESNRSAGSQYEMNQTRIFRLAKIFLQELDQSLTEALEPLMTDRINQPWSQEEMQLVLRAEHGILEGNEEFQLQQTLEISFDTSHPEFCKETALANLRRNFSDTPIDLCKECLHVKHQEELDEHDGYCTEYVPPPPPIFEPEPDTILMKPTQDDQTIVTIEVFETLQQQVVQQNQTIEQLQQQVQKLENFNQQLLCLIHQDTQYLQQRTETLATLFANTNF